MVDVYERLRERLNQMATGFPATQSRVELKLLKRLFTEEEAEFFISLPPKPMTPSDLSQRLDRDPEKTAELMETMSAKGLLFRRRKSGAVFYVPVPYLVGIYEFQVGRMDRDTAEIMEKYFETGLGRTIQSFDTPVMRTIPINQKLVAKWPVAPYEDVCKILENQETIAIAPCVCRKTRQLADKGCDKPLDTCFLFGSHAHYYVENKMGRYISKEEASRIVKKNEEAGLVMQPFNSQKIGGMCSCCGDCCGILRSLKMQPVPAGSVQSNYFAEMSPGACTGCEICMDRCQMAAIQLVNEVATIDLNRCIGCGLCVTTCPAEAIHLVKKTGDQVYEPPKTGRDTYVRIGVERGKKSIAEKI